MQYASISSACVADADWQSWVSSIQSEESEGPCVHIPCGQSNSQSIFLLTDLPMMWRCWHVALLWDMCGNNKLVWQTHTCMHMRHGVTNRFSVTMWDPQHINNTEPLTIAGIKLLTLSTTSFLPCSEFLSIFPPSLTHHPPIHLRWLHYPPHCNSQKTERELESRQQEEQSCWFWLATFKYDKIKTFLPPGGKMLSNRQKSLYAPTTFV